MKKIEFKSCEHGIDIEIERRNSDGGDPMGISEEGFQRLFNEMKNGMFEAVTSALDQGILPRHIRLEGIFTVNGIYEPRKKGGEE